MTFEIPLTHVTLTDIPFLKEHPRDSRHIMFDIYKHSSRLFLSFQTLYHKISKFLKYEIVSICFGLKFIPFYYEISQFSYLIPEMLFYIYE